MTNLVKDVTLTKVAATLVGVAMVAGLAFSVAAERAHAVTLAELVELFIALDIIPADKAADARAVLSNQPGTTTGGTTSGGSCAFNFTRNLNVGASGADVKNLQVFLNMSADTQVAASGAGSPGMETMYFGPATKSAVAKFQQKYSAEILAPLGLTAGTGFFGASTRDKANKVCAGGTPGTPGVPGVPGTPGTPGTGTSTDDDNLSGGEASLEEFDLLNDPSGEDVAEGNELVKVAGWEFEVKDADVSLNRVDVRFEATAGDSGYSHDPWDSFESVALYLGDEKIAEMDADSSSDWDNLAGNAFGMRFTGLSEKIDEDDVAELYVAVTAVSNLDANDDGTTWNVWIANDGIRARDGAGIDQYTGDASAGFERTFTTEAAGADDELKVALATSNPDASTIQVDADDRTDDQTILVFTLEAEGNDIEVTSIPVQLLFAGGASYATMIADIKLEIDGTTFDDFTVASSTTMNSATTTFEIDSEDLVIEKDEKVTVKVIVDFLKQSGNYSAGASVTAKLDTLEVDAIEAEGGDDLAAADLTGSAIGEAQTVQTSGLFAEIVSVTETRTAGDNNANDIGSFVFKVDVTAFDTTAYISATTSSATTTAGTFVYHVEDGNGTTISNATAGTIGTSTDSSLSTALSSTATLQSNAYRIDEGETETFTFTVTANPNATGYYRVELDSINFGTTVDAFGSSHTASPDQDFESENLYLVR